MKRKPWKLLSCLLLYPDEELLAADEELRREAAGLPRVLRFLDWQRQAPLAELQRTYVETFDFERRASLHLTYHTHGDRRQRGLELVRLRRRYRETGLPMDGDELPDYLPALLEFADLSPEPGEALLAELRPSIELVRAALRERRSPYADLLDTLADALPRPTRKQLEAARRIAAEGPPTELVGLEAFAAGVAS